MIGIGFPDPESRGVSAQYGMLSATGGGGYPTVSDLAPSIRCGYKCSKASDTRRYFSCSTALICLMCVPFSASRNLHSLHSAVGPEMKARRVSRTDSIMIFNAH